MLMKHASNEALAEAMRAKGYDPGSELDRTKFAVSIEVAEKSIRNWLKGGRPNRNLGKRAARHLGVRYEDLFGANGARP